MNETGIIDEKNLTQLEENSEELYHKEFIEIVGTELLQKAISKNREFGNKLYKNDH